MMSYIVYEVGFNRDVQLHGIVPLAVRHNAEFRADYLARLSEMLGDDLSRENVNGIIDELTAILEPEVSRDMARWGYDESIFRQQLINLKGFTQNRVRDVINATRIYFGLSDAEMEQYFAHIQE